MAAKRSSVGGRAGGRGLLVAAPAAVALVVVAILVILLFASCGGDGGTDPPPQLPAECATSGGVVAGDPTKAVVLLRNFTFLPDTIRASPGVTVTWVNCEPPGPDPHTSTSVNDLWRSGFLRQGEKYSRTFGEAGRFGYYCEPHPTMRGGVVVQ